MSNLAISEVLALPRRTGWKTTSPMLAGLWMSLARGRGCSAITTANRTGNGSTAAPGEGARCLLAIAVRFLCRKHMAGSGAHLRPEQVTRRRSERTGTDGFGHRAAMNAIDRALHSAFRLGRAGEKIGT